MHVCKPIVLGSSIMLTLLNPTIHHLAQLGRQWKGGVLDLKERVFYG